MGLLINKPWPVEKLDLWVEDPLSSSRSTELEKVLLAFYRKFFPGISRSLLDCEQLEGRVHVFPGYNLYIQYRMEHTVGAQ